jgi:hypothetical protein
MNHKDGDAAVAVMDGREETVPENNANLAHSIAQLLALNRTTVC